MSDQNEAQQQVQYPRYRCYKVVEAVKIADISPLNYSFGGVTIVPADNGYKPFNVSVQYIEKHHPQIGGYWIRYRDGYESWSPASEFEDGYTRIEE